MAITKKTFRYYYWLLKEFIRKNVRLIVVSFIISFLFIIAFISLSPSIQSLVSLRSDKIGLVGAYDFNSLPDDIINKISNGLVYVDEKGDIIPVLASSWEVRQDGKFYRFHLKDGLIWDDGKKFAATDISYQFKDITVKVVDQRTIDFTLKMPLSIFPTYLRKPLIRYPLIGIGNLYHVSSFKSKFGSLTELTLEPNKKDLATIKYLFYKNEEQMVTAYKLGEINQFFVNKKSIADSYASWKNTTVDKSIDYTQLMTLFFNNNNQLLQQKDVKDALHTAIDYSKLNDKGEVALGPIQPISWAYNPDLKKNVYDPENSSKIIKKYVEASQSAQLNLVTYYDYYDIGDEIATDFKNAGLSVNLNVASFTQQGNFDFLLALWKVPSDPDQYFFWHSTQTQGNIGNYKNVKIDKLLEDGRNTLSIADRKKIYLDYQRIMQDDPPAIFLYYPYIYTIKRK